MRFTKSIEGVEVEFECIDNFVSRWVAGDILEGKIYPLLPFVGDVQTVLDVGANCGAASVLFAHHYPKARIHAFEPAEEPRRYLERNVGGRTNVTTHAFGLHSSDQRVPLFRGAEDPGSASIFRRPVNVDDSEVVHLRDAGAWAAEEGIERIDVMKLDTEGCEIEILESIEELIPTLKVLYVEYHSRQGRRDLGRLLDDTHELYGGKMLLDQGEIVYLRKDLASTSDAMAFVAELGKPSVDSAATANGK